MTITLNPKSIFDEIFALSALQAFDMPDVERPSLLTRDQIPGLRHLLRIAFANLMIQFAESISSCRFDDVTQKEPYNPDYHFNMTVELNGSVGENSALLIKANMEHILALCTLSFVHECSNPEMARDYRRQAAEAATLLGDEIDPDVPAGRLACWYY